MKSASDIGEAGLAGTIDGWIAGRRLDPCASPVFQDGFAGTVAQDGLRLELSANLPRTRNAHVGGEGQHESAAVEETVDDVDE